MNYPVTITNSTKMFNVLEAVHLLLSCILKHTHWAKDIIFNALKRFNALEAVHLLLLSCILEHTYWAKDIIFLLTEYEEIGMQAWLSAYHDSPTHCG